MSRPHPTRAGRRRQSGLLRVVLDGPVLLRCLLGQDDVAVAARRAWQGGVVQPLVSPATARSLIGALTYPGLGLGAAQQQDLLGDFLPFAEVVHPTVLGGRGLTALPQHQRDVLALACSGAAQQLLSFHPALLRWSATPAAGRLLPGCQVLSAVKFFPEIV